MTTETFSNNATSPLAVSVTTTPAQGTQETWTVNSTSSFPQTPGQARFIIDNEIVIGVTPPASGTTLVVTRGAEGTTPATHAAGIQLKQDATAGSLGVFLQTDTTVPTPSTTVLGARVTSDTFDRLQLQPQIILLGTGATAPDIGIIRATDWHSVPFANSVAIALNTRNGLVIPIGGDDSITWTNSAVVANNRSAAYWVPDGLTHDLSLIPGTGGHRVLLGGDAQAFTASWAQVSSSGLNSSVPVSVQPTGAVDAQVTLNSPAGRWVTFQFQQGGTWLWRFYSDGTNLTYRDDVNNRTHFQLTPGATNVAATTEFFSLLHAHAPITVTGDTGVDASVTLLAGSGAFEGFRFQEVSGNVWGIEHSLGATTLRLHDFVNSRDHITLTPGATSATAVTEIASQLQVDGPLVTSGGVRYSIATVSATGPITATTTLVNAAGGAVTATLPSVAAGLRCEVKKTDASANAVTVTPATGTIDGATSFVLTAQYQSVTLVSDGTNWWVV